VKQLVTLVERAPKPAQSQQDSKQLVRYRAVLPDFKGLSVTTRGRKRGRANGRAMAPSLPPTIRNNLQTRQVLRFYNTAAITGSNSNVTNTDIFGAIGVIGRVVNSTVTPFASSFKINSVTIWPASGSGSSDVSVTFQEQSNDSSEDLEMSSAMPASVTTTSMFRAYPPKNSLASFWINETQTSGLVFMNIILSGTGSIVDLDVTWTLPTGWNSSQTISVSTAAVGTFYRLALNHAVAANTLVPVDYATTL
jgi:hypothetical protein